HALPAPGELVDDGRAHAAGADDDLIEDVVAHAKHCSVHCRGRQPDAGNHLDTQRLSLDKARGGYGALMSPTATDRSAIAMLSAPISAAMRALAIYACLLGAAAGATGQSEWGRGADEAGNQHPLAGRLYDVAKGRLADPVPAAGTPALVLPDGLVL